MKRRISDVGPRPAIDGGQRRVTRTRAAAGRGLPLCIVCTQSLRPESVASARRRGALPAVTLRGSSQLPPRPDSLALAGLPSLASHWKAAPVTQARRCGPAVSQSPRPKSHAAAARRHSRLLPDLPNLKFPSLQVTRRGPPRLRPTHLSCRGPKSLAAPRARARVTHHGSTSLAAARVTRRGPSHSPLPAFNRRCLSFRSSQVTRRGPPRRPTHLPRSPRPGSLAVTMAVGLWPSPGPGPAAAVSWHLQPVAGFIRCSGCSGRPGQRAAAKLHSKQQPGLRLRRAVVPCPAAAGCSGRGQASDGGPDRR